MANPENIENHKFEPGKSGNPNGRPRGFKGLTKTLSEIIESDGSMVVSDIIEIDEDGNETGRIIARGKIRIPRKEMIIMAATRKAMKGDLRAIEFIFDRIEGKATQPVLLPDLSDSAKGFYDYYMMSQNGDKITEK